MYTINNLNSLIRAFIWDMESVLATPNWNRCYDMAYAALGLPAPHAVDPERGKIFKKILSVVIDTEKTKNLNTYRTGDCEKNFLQAYSSGHISAEEFWPIACEYGFGLKPTPENIEAIRTAQTYLLRDKNKNVQFIPEVVEVMTSMANVMPQYILSNTNQEIYDGYKDSSFMDAIQEENRLFSHLIECRKPSDKAFHFAIEKSGFQPPELLFIDDKLENVEAARRNGMKAIQFNGVKQPISDLITALLEYGIEVNECVS